MSYLVEAPFVLPLPPVREGDPTAALIVKSPAIAEPYHALMVANQSRLAQWEPWAANPMVLAETRAHLARSTAGWSDGTQLPLAILVGAADSWTLAGAIGLRVDLYSASGKLGYWIDAANEGTGVVTRACRAVLEQAFGSYGLARVEIHTEVANTRSRAVAARLGFMEEGVLRASIPIHGGRRDTVVYGLLAPEWHEVNAAIASPAGSGAPRCDPACRSPRRRRGSRCRPGRGP